MRSIRKTFKVLLWGTLTILFIFAPVSRVVAQTCVGPPQGLISWWDADSVSGTTAYDIWNGNDGTLMGGATTAPGMVGDAFSFDGLNDQIILPSIDNLPMGDAPRTVVAWVNCGQNQNPGRPFKPILDYGENRVDQLFSVLLSPAGQHQKCPAGEFNRILVASWYDDVCSTGVVPEDTWTHIGVVYHGGGNIDFYINGAYDSSDSFDSDLDTQHSWRPQAIGGRDYYVWFPGLIDEVAIFDSALLASEIQDIFDLGSAGMCKDMCKDLLYMIAELADQVLSLNLQNGISNSLDAKLDTVLQALNDINENNDVAAVNALGAFINAVEAQSGSKISQADADALIFMAQTIIDCLRGS